MKRMNTHTNEYMISEVKTAMKGLFESKRNTNRTSGCPVLGPLNFSRTAIMAVLAIAFFLCVFVPNYAGAATAGPNNPSSGANNTTIGTRAWGSASNVVSSNNKYASATSLTTSTVSNYLVATGFGFAIPAGSTINGIQVSIERRDGEVSSSRYIWDNSVKIVKAGAITGSEHANTTANWPTSDASASYGSTTDLWGTTWTAADINAANFGVAISARGSSSSNETARVDNIRITVTYTTGAVCTAAAPTVTITPAPQTITTNAASVAYMVTVLNNDTGTGCSNVTYTLSVSDSNTVAFNPSTLSSGSVTLPAGATSSPITLTVSARSGQTTGTNTTTVTASATGHPSGSASVTTILSVSGGGSTAGPNNPTSGANNTSIGTRAWSNAANVVSSNNQYVSATSLTTSAVSNYLTATGFGFSIPAGSTINGIQVSIERSDGGVSSSSYIRDNSIKIVKAGAITGTEHADTTANWPTSDASASYGSTTDLWGTTWTAADINASNFGVAISARGSSSSSETARIDNIRITVSYTSGSSSCTAAAPTVSITTLPKTIIESGASAGYSVQITNNDIGSGCSSVIFALSASDSNTVNFDASALNTTSVTLAPGETSIGTVHLTVKGKLGQVSGTNTTTISAAASGHATGSAGVVTTLNVVCTLSAPTLVISPGTKLIQVNGGSVAYTLNILNNDTAYACTASSTFTLSVSDSNSGSFVVPSTLSQNSVSLAPGANANITLTVRARAGFSTGTNDTTVNASAINHAIAVSNTVITSIDIPGVCVANAPLLVIDPAGTVPPGSTATYLVTVTNSDTSACSASTFTLNVVSDSNSVAFTTPSTLNPLTLSLAPGATSAVVLSVNARDTAAEGSMNTTVVRVSAAGHASPANVSVSTTVSSALPPTTAKLVHNSVTTGSAYWSTQGGWGVTGGKYGQFVCTTCHVAEAVNIKRIKGTITVPDTSKGNIPGTTVNFQTISSTGSFGNDLTTHTSSQKICEVCHTQTSVHKYNQPTVVPHESSVGINDCIVCHKHNQGFKPAGGCTICHALPLGNRIAVTGQFSGNSHHVQTNGTPVTDVHCYQCHWEANADGSINTTYHGGAAAPGSPVNLVIYGAGTRPTTYTLNTTAVAYTANGQRAEILKINNHCLGCHSTQNNNIMPFGDGKTPKEYAWDNTSVADRYSQPGTTIWGKYSGAKTTPKNTQTKAYSAHGNALNNQRGWNLTETWPNTSGTVQVLCFDCHNSHGSSVSGKTTMYTSVTPNGGILKDTTAGKGGYAMTYKPQPGGSVQDKNARNAGASICFDCHMTQNSGTTPWGYQNTFGSTQAILGYMENPYWFGAAGANPNGSQQRYPYKNLIGSKGSHFGASSPLSTDPTRPVLGTIGGLCTPCHDPHGVSKTLNQAYSVPLLKGTWLTSPYLEDSTPLSTTDVHAETGEEGNRPAFSMASTPGYNIDQNTFDAGTLRNVSGLIVPTWNFNAAQRITETTDQFAGLCLRCHPKTSINKTTGGSWRSLDRVHNTVKSWGGAGTNANNAVHSYPCAKCHTPHNSPLNRLLAVNCLDVKHRGGKASGGIAVNAFVRGEEGSGVGKFPAGGGGRGEERSYAYFFGTTSGTRACHDNTNTDSWPNNQLWNTKSMW
jgi:hypothetical protein